MDRDDDDFGEGFIAESHPLRPTLSSQLSVPLGRNNSRAPSISSSVSDLDAPIYTRETTIPVRRGSKEDVEEQPSTPTALAPSTKTSAHKEAGLNGRLVFAIAAAALGSAFQHGYNTGVINAPKETIGRWINTTKLDRTGKGMADDEIESYWSIVVSIFCAGGMIGGALVGVLADRFGRKGALLLTNILVVLTAILEGCSKMAASYEMLIIGRLIIGINCGLNAGLAPMYLSEISPMHLRGAIGSVYQLIVTISILVSQILGLSQLLGTDHHWPLLLALTIVPAIFQCLTLPLCPESPKYLLLCKGQDADAQRALKSLRGTNDVHEEMEEMKAEHEAMKMLPTVGLRDLFVNSALRIPMVIAIVVMLAQQLSGINAIFFYSTSIFENAGLSQDAAKSATMGVGAVNVVMTLVSLVLVEKYGRKTLLLFGFGGMAIVTALLTISMTYAPKKVENMPTEPNGWSYMCIILIILFVVLFACGPGSIPWFLVSEIFNQSARPVATSVAIAINWGANFAVGLAFPQLQIAMSSLVFIIFVVFQTLSTAFIWKKVPETKGKTIEEVSSLFRQRTYQ